MWIFFFLLNVIFSGMLSFLLGRAVDIGIQVVVGLVTLSFLISEFYFLFLQHQHQQYHEVIVSGDLSEDDLERANTTQHAGFDVNLPIFSSFVITIILQQNLALTWTLAPFSSHGELPPVVFLNWKDESVFFSEIVPSQLVPGGSGFGTFNLTATAPSLNINSQDLVITKPTVEVETGSVLRWVIG